MNSSRNRFTLVELLVVIAIIAVLAAILLPTLNKVKNRAYDVYCISNLKQIGNAIELYRDDFDQMPPWLSTLVGTDKLDPSIGRYLGSERALRCPFDGNDKDTAQENWKSRPDNTYCDSYDRRGNEGIYGNDPNYERVEHVSYFYEFSEAECEFNGSENSGGENPNSGRSWNEVKTSAINYGRCDIAGPFEGQSYGLNPHRFPTVRCFWHLKTGRAPVFNLSWSGNTFNSLLMWEKGSWDKQ